MESKPRSRLLWELGFLWLKRCVNRTKYQWLALKAWKVKTTSAEVSYCMFSLFEGASFLPQWHMWHMLITCVFFPWETVLLQHIYEPENSWSHQSYSAPWNGLMFRTAKGFCSLHWMHKQTHVWTTLLQIHSQNKSKLKPAENTSGRSVCYTDQMPFAFGPKNFQAKTLFPLTIKLWFFTIHQQFWVYLGALSSPPVNESCSKGLKIRCCASAEIPQPGPSCSETNVGKQKYVERL